MTGIFSAIYSDCLQIHCILKVVTAPELWEGMEKGRREEQRRRSGAERLPAEVAWQL